MQEFRRARSDSSAPHPSVLTRPRPKGELSACGQPQRGLETSILLYPVSGAEKIYRNSKLQVFTIYDCVCTPLDYSGTPAFRRPSTNTSQWANLPKTSRTSLRRNGGPTRLLAIMNS